MRDVIQKVIAAENEAKLTTEKAKAEAGQILSDAQKAGHDLLERTRQEAVTEAQKIVDAAIGEAGRKKQQQLARAAVEIESQIQLDPATRQWAVEGIVRCVCKQP